jgi:hypothetical protein
MTEGKIVDRVRKLLELAKSDNVNEAGNAAKQAQILMARHNIAEATVSALDGEPQEEIEKDLLHRGDKAYASWKGTLALAVCEANQCVCYRTGHGGDMNIVGRPSDANTVRYLFSYLVREIDRLCEAEASLRGNPGRTWRNNFRHGAVEAIDRRLREANREARSAARKEASDGDTLGTGAALVRVDSAIAKIDQRLREVEDYAARSLKLRAGKASSSRYNPEGREAGRRAGSQIDLGNAHAGLGSGERRKLGS